MCTPPGVAQDSPKGTSKKAEAKATPKTAEKSRKKSSPDKKPPASPSPKSSSDELDIPVPEGVPVKGIKVPSYGPDGKLQMMLNAEVARKIDGQRIEFENLQIDAYSDDGRKFYVELPRSVFNLETRILAGESRVLIRREDFEITGDAGEFHTKTRFAKILGNIKMVILSSDIDKAP